MRTNSNTIKTLDFGYVSIRSNDAYTEGFEVGYIDMANGDSYIIKRDTRTNQPFAVLDKENSMIWDSKKMQFVNKY